MTAVVLHCTCPDAASAGRIAEALVAEQLAACVQQLPGMVSTFRWEGRVERTEEILLLIKTVEERIPAILERVRALHPYDVPELLALDVVGGAPDYLDWVHAQSRTDA